MTLRDRLHRLRLRFFRRPQYLAQLIEDMLFYAPRGKTAIDQAINSDLARRLGVILTDKAFLKLKLPVQYRLLDYILDIFSQTHNRHSLELAPQVATVFRAYLARPDVDLERLIKTYDMLHMLYWVAATRNEDMRPFDAQVVVPFSRFLADYCRKEGLPERRELSGEPAIRLCYLSEFSYFGEGNALANVLHSVLKGHALLGSKKFEVFFYSWMYNSDEFLEKIRGLGVSVRKFELHKDWNNLALLRQAFRDDRVDVVITEVSTGVPSYLFESRVAPVQIFYELGFPFWTIPGVDAVLEARGVEPASLGMDPAKVFSIPNVFVEGSLERGAQGVAEERLKFPPARQVLGYYGRLSKVTEPYLEMLGKVLSHHPDTIGILAGTGDPQMINEFIRRRGLSKRLFLVNEFVHGPLYAQLFYIFLDTFPFIGGVSCREAMEQGRPVVSMDSADWRGMLIKSRDPQLLAGNASEYAALVLRLLDDPIFYEQASRASREIAGREKLRPDTAQAIEAIVERLVAALQEKAIKLS